MADLQTLVSKLLVSGPHKTESTSRRVRALFDGKWIFDTTTAKYVWENAYYPQFYVPLSSVNPDIHLTKTKSLDDSNTAFAASIKGKQRETDRVLVFEKGVLEGLVRFEFKAMDAWFEEDVQAHGDHPRSPYTRIDILPSSRKVEVKIGGVTVAESSSASFLFETGLRTRYYLPKTSVMWEFVTKSETTSKCPYKGRAQYYNVTVGGKEIKDVIWWYEHPTAESVAIAGMVCFYNEKVDTYIDGVLEEK